MARLKSPFPYGRGIKRIDTRLGKIESCTKQLGGTLKRSYKHAAPQQADQSRPHRNKRTADGSPTVDGPDTGANVLVISVLPVQHTKTQTGHSCVNSVMTIAQCIPGMYIVVATVLIRSLHLFPDNV